MQQEENDYFQSEEFLDILSRYEQAINSGHSPYMDCDELIDVADFYMSQGKYQQAQDATELAMELHPDETDPVSMMADIMFETRNWTEAISWLDKVLDNDPFDIQAWQNMTDAQLHTEKFLEALESIEYTLAIQPENELAILQKAFATSRLERCQEAKELYEQYLAKNPDDDIALYQAAFNLCIMERFEEANELLIHAEEVSQGMSPEQLNICLQHSYTEARIGHLQEALDALERAKEYNVDNSDVDYNLLTGHIYMIFHLQNKAIDYFTKAISESKDMLNTMRSIAQIFMDCTYFDFAAHTFEQLEEIADLPEYSESKDEIIKAICPSQAYCYYLTGKRKEFIRYLKMAVAINPKDTKTLFQDIFPKGVLPEEYPYYIDSLDNFFNIPSE